MADEEPTTIGWELEEDQRSVLLRRFRPRFRHPIAEHVTLASDVAIDVALPAGVGAEIVGRVDDGQGVEVMIVAVEGSTARPGGGTFHITWSLADGRRPEESNDVIAERSWVELDQPVPVRLRPARFV